MVLPSASSIKHGQRLYHQFQLDGPVPNRLAYQPTLDRSAYVLSEAVAADRDRIPSRFLKAGIEGDSVFDRFQWLPAFLAHGQDGAGRARALTKLWLERYGNFSATPWSPSRSADRLFFWLTSTDIITEGQDAPWRLLFMQKVAEHARHLRRVERRLTIGTADALHVAIVRSIASLCLPEEVGVGVPATNRLIKQLQSIADGSLPRRWRDLDLLRSMITMLRTLTECFLARRLSPPLALPRALRRAEHLLRAHMSGPGELGAWAGVTPWSTEPTLLPAAGPEAVFQLNAIGRHRVTAETAQLLIDLGQEGDPVSSAGAFALYDGATPVIVNCGRPSRLAASIDPTLFELDKVLQQAPACSGLDTLPHAPASMRCDDGIEGQLVDLERLGTHGSQRRRLLISPTGDELRGEDKLDGLNGIGVLRFHLPAAAEVIAMTPGDRPNARFKAPDGKVWILTAAGGTLTEEEGLVATRAGRPDESSQFVIVPLHAGVRWSIKRASSQR